MLSHFKIQAPDERSDSAGVEGCILDRAKGHVPYTAWAKRLRQIHVAAYAGRVDCASGRYQQGMLKAVLHYFHCHE